MEYTFNCEFVKLYIIIIFFFVEDISELYVFFVSYFVKYVFLIRLVSF